MAAGGVRARWGSAEKEFNPRGAEFAELAAAAW
jgi:hypothetical protein